MKIDDNPLLQIAMENTVSFLDEQSGKPTEFLDHVVVIPLHTAMDIINDMADQIDILMKANQKLKE